MKKAILLISILFISVVTTACINNYAVKELNNKAMSYLNDGDTETAICRLKSSLDLDNEIFETHYNLAVAYVSAGNYDGALESVKRVLELNPEFFDAYYLMGNALEGQAYNIIQKQQNTDETGEEYKLTQDDINFISTKLEEAIEKYNEYLTKKTNANDVDKVNAKISELNEELKKYTDVQIMEENQEPSSNSVAE